jgi:hypothetical protein
VSFPATRSGGTPCLAHAAHAAAGGAIIWRMTRVGALAAALGSALLLSITTTASAGTFATTDPDDSPEGVVTIGDTVFVSTTPLLPEIALGSGTPSEIYRFDRTGRLLGRIVVQGERLLGGVQGIAGLTSDPQGRLLANDAQGRVLRFTERREGTFAQETYATVADLRPCAVAPMPCSAHPADLEPLVNEVARLRDGTLLLSDSFQAAVWRVPPGGGAAQLLVTDARLVGTAFGPNGIAASPNGKEAVLAVSSDPDGEGVLYRFALDRPVLAELARLGSDQFPDGLQWLGPDRLYVTMSSANAVALFDADDGEE